MAVSGAELGFDYTQAVCRAVELYTSAMEARNPAAFEYRGANLKYAVERLLYFAFINDERQYAVFAACRRGGLSDAVEVPTELDRDMAGHICGSDLPPNFVQVKPREQAGEEGLLRRARRRIGLALGSLLSPDDARVAVQPGPPAAQAGARPRVLIYVIQEKFARYLLPITDRLPVPFAYLLNLNLATLNHELEPFFLKQGLPYIKSLIPSLSSKVKRVNEVLVNFYHLTDWYDQVYAGLEKIRPECLVLVEGNAPQDAILHQACVQLSIPMVCVQQGWSPIVHNGFRNMSYTKMLVWGDGFRDMLQPFNPAQTFVVTGNHLVESNEPSDLPGQSSRRAICFFMQGVSQLISREHREEFLRLATRIGAEFPDIPVLVREHPSYPLSVDEQADLARFPSIRLMPSREYSMAEILGASRLSVSIYSSTILESIAGGVLPLIFNMTSLPTYYPDVQAAGAGIEVKTLDAAMRTIRRIVADDAYGWQFAPAMEQFRQRYFSRDRRRAADRIVQEIVSLCRAPRRQ